MYRRSGSHKTACRHIFEHSSSYSCLPNLLFFSSVGRNNHLISPIMSSESTNKDTAIKILRIIEKYGLNYQRTGTWDGFDTFLPIVQGQVERGEPVRMLLPGFPFKSPNTQDKVLGTLPDLGEEIALKHLDGLCTKIDAVYEHGSEMHITSDGLVYNGNSYNQCQLTIAS